ncbi:hypothetical protein BDF14DRAFT_1993856 [Spinellus fusiger]|nr:hypothetical protein BDF14DRAFT_1993856 [Spinellus fusiger]
MSVSYQQPASTSTKLMLVSGMLFFGVCNTILNKYQDMQCVGNCTDPDPTKRRYFEQPLWQTLNMFIGEFAVWSVYLYQVWQSRTRIPPSAVNTMNAAVIIDDVGLSKPYEKKKLTWSRSLLFWIPTLCDLTGTTIMNVGLLLTSASVYQMLRGAVVIFTGIFSYLFLNRRLRSFEWVSLILVVSGVSIVGLSSVFSPQTDAGFEEDSDIDYKSLLGVGLVLSAQLFTATVFVVEEKIMAHYDVTPLKAVGLEGTFGLISVLLAMPILHFFLADTHPTFDIRVGFHDFFDNPVVWQIGLIISISIAFFNWFGLSITTSVSSTSRSTIDACRTLFIWMVSLFLGWEQFSIVQVVGFAVMVMGTFYFNGVISWPLKSSEEDESERSPLLQSQQDHE